MMPLKWFLCCLMLGCLLAAPAARAGELVGRCVAVIDGLTLDVLHAGRTERVRLDGIGCPEPGKPFGVEARQALASCVADKVIRVKEMGRDAEGRVLGVVYNLDNWNVNATLVHNGFAWVAGPASRDARLATAEALARRMRKGLWGSQTLEGLGLVRNDREVVITSETLAALRAPTEPGARVYITSFGRKYHTLACKFTTAQKIPVFLSSLAEDYEPCTMCGPPAMRGARQDNVPSRSNNGFGISEEERQARLKLLLVTGQLPRSNSQAGLAAPYARGGGEKLSIIEEPVPAGQTATGLPIYIGPRGGRYHISKTGKKVYERKK